jgi:hypothetical protein
MSTKPKSIDETMALLATEPGIAEACGEVESWARAGRWQDLVALAKAIEAGSPEGRDPKSRFETLADHVEDQLALANAPEALEGILDLSLADRRRSVSVPRDRALRVRAFASRLGFGQSVEGFARALGRFGDDASHQELLACWMQEIILRGTSLEGETRAVRFRSTLAAANHPLAVLPLALRPVEREAPSYMPLYGAKGLGRAIEHLTSGAMSVRTVPPPADGADVSATPKDDGDAVRRMRAAVEPWSKIEAKLFDLSPSVSGGSIGSWLLRALNLDATAGATRLDCMRTGAEGTFGPLFSAASNGGAYSAGLGGAYGRLAAWTSLGALVGARAGAEIAAVESLSEECTFLAFRAAGPWFFDVAWDLGALVLRADGRTAAVLAATDSD